MAFRHPRAAYRPLASTTPVIPPAVDEGVPARAPRTIKHPERHEQNAIRGLLTSLGGRVYVLGTTRRKGDFAGTMQTPGLPDLIAFLPNRGVLNAMTLLVVECKAKGGRLRPEQAVFRDLCRRADVYHIVGGVDVVLAWLMEQGYVKAENVPHYRLPKNLQERA